MSKKYVYSFPLSVVGIGTEGLNLVEILRDDVEDTPFWFVPPAARWDVVDSDLG